MGQIQFIQITPEQLQSEILKGVKSELEQLKKDFQPKQSAEFLTRQEVAQLLKIDISTVHNWTKRGKLKSYGMVGRVYYRRDEVEAALIEL